MSAITVRLLGNKNDTPHYSISGGGKFSNPSFLLTHDEVRILYGELEEIINDSRVTEKLYSDIEETKEKTIVNLRGLFYIDNKFGVVQIGACGNGNDALCGTGKDFESALSILKKRTALCKV
jgi:hypothetical protein